MVEDKDSSQPTEDESEAPASRSGRLTRSLSATHMNGGPSTSTANNNGAAATSSSSNGDVTSWECSVCTYQNTEEEFKCAMCESRKGTSTRKPRATSQTQIVQIQALAAEVAKQSNATLRKQRRRLLRQQQQQSSGNTSRNARLKNVDRARGTRTNVTVNNVTVVITDYPLKNDNHRPPSSSSSTRTTPPVTTPPPPLSTSPLRE